VALVGYTNAGKSSLMRALTGERGLRRRQALRDARHHRAQAAPETTPRVLVSDTVGFIKKLPHDLVASFRSTLDEAREASLVLHVVDGADPAWPRTLQLRDAIVAWFQREDPPFELFVPWSRSALVGRIRAAATVVSEAYEDDGVRYVLRAPESVATELRAAAE
jgi:GTP-binding protein HflX